MKILYIADTKTNPVIKEVEEDLKSFQEMVGGNIELYQLHGGIYAVLNKEGKGLAPNRTIPNGDFICGPFFVTRIDENGAHTDLTDEDLLKWGDRFFNRSSLEVFYFNDFENADLIGEISLNNITFGDAEYTLVYPSQLIEEVESREEAEPLLKELEQVPPGLLIAFEG